MTGLGELDALMEPRSIAIVGASPNEDKVGYRPLRYLMDSGYSGRILPVNPNYNSIEGLDCYSSILDVADKVDLALLCLPAVAVLSAARDCAAASVRAVVVFGAGFAETGDEGRLIQSQLAEVCRDAGMRLLGPNCLGAINTATGVMATFAGVVRDLAPPKPGILGVASQSGAIGSHILAQAHQMDVGISQYISTGNEADIDIADAIAYMALDRKTRVIASYIEGLRNGPRLVEALRLAANNGKRVVVLKGGRSVVGHRAAASHTDALAGDGLVYESVLTAAGAICVESLRDLFILTRTYTILDGRPVLQAAASGHGVGILTPSGGGGILLADAAESAGLSIPLMPRDAAAELRSMWPTANFDNPVDVTARSSSDPGMMATCISAMFDKGNYAAVMLFMTYVGLNEEFMAWRMAPVLRVAERFSDRLLVVCAMSTGSSRRHLESLGVPVFEEPADAVMSVAAVLGQRSVAAVLGQRDEPSRPPASPPSRSLAPGPEETRLPPPAILRERSSFSERESLAIVAQNGIAVVPQARAASEDEAVSAAESFGYPVVIKIDAENLAHKSDVGGVALDLRGAKEVRNAFRSVIASVQTRAPDANIAGVLVSPMRASDLEFIVGTFNDLTFGPMVICGVGGIYAEILSDVVIRPAPVNHVVAHSMIMELRAADLLKGVRGRPPANTDDLCHVVSRLSRIGADLAPYGLGVEINPYAVGMGQESGAALDALVSRSSRYA